MTQLVEGICVVSALRLSFREKVRDIDTARHQRSRVLGLNLIRSWILEELMMDYRRCRGCKRVRTLRAFDLNSRTRDGINYYCRECGTKGAVNKRDLGRTKRRCKICRKQKLSRYFPADARTRDGKSKICLACHR